MITVQFRRKNVGRYIQLPIRPGLHSEPVNFHDKRIRDRDAANCDATSMNKDVTTRIFSIGKQPIRTIGIIEA